MRPLGTLAGGALTILALAGFSPAVAQTLPASGATSLFTAPFVSSQAPAAARKGGFTVAVPEPVATSARLAPADRLVGDGVTQWRATEFSRKTGAGAVDTIRLSMGGIARAPGGVVTAAPDSLLATETRDYDLTYTRDWPAAVRFAAGAYPGDLSPYAGLGLGTAGGSAQAGAMVRYGPGAGDDKVLARLAQMGVRDGATFGDAGRWYLFAAASGRAVGLNMARSSDGGGLHNAGWSTDTAALIGDAQVGVGWRKGALQTSVGYLHREFEPRNPMPHTDFVDDDQMVAFSLSIKPQK